MKPIKIHRFRAIIHVTLRTEAFDVLSPPRNPSDARQVQGSQEVVFHLGQLRRMLQELPVDARQLREELQGVWR